MSLCSFILASTQYSSISLNSFSIPNPTNTCEVVTAKNCSLTGCCQSLTVLFAKQYDFFLLVLIVNALPQFRMETKLVIWFVMLALDDLPLYSVWSFIYQIICLQTPSLSPSFSEKVSAGTSVIRIYTQAIKLTFDRLTQAFIVSPYILTNGVM